MEGFGPKGFRGTEDLTTDFTDLENRFTMKEGKEMKKKTAEKTAPGIETIKQNDRISCGACCAAMIAGTDLETAIKEMKLHPKGGYDVIEIHKFCLKRGFTIGGCCYAQADDQYIPLDGDGNVTLLLNPSGQAYLVGVASERLEGKQHWIYWCGRHVHDPSPEVDDTKRTLADYKIIDIGPVHKIS